MIVRESVHEISNGKGIRLISFAAAKYMIINRKIFPHKNIHKVTGKSLYGITNLTR